MSRILILLISFLTGFAVMGFEILGSRVLAPYYGSNVQVLGAMLAVFMAGMGIGYAIGGRLADKKCGYRQIGTLLMVPAVYFFIFPWYGLGTSLLVYRMELNFKLSLLLTSFLIFMLPNLFLGAVFPFLVKFTTENIDKVGTRCGNIYSISTFGYVTGTIFTSFFLINWLPTSVAVQTMGLPLVICSIFCFIAALKTKK